jgi:hypothetical protein
MASVVAATSYAFTIGVATSTFTTGTIAATTFTFTVGIVGTTNPAPFITTCTFSLSGVSYEQHWNNQNTHNF